MNGGGGSARAAGKAVPARRATSLRTRPSDALAVSLLALLCLVSCSGRSDRPPDILGEINNEYLTADEFVHHLRVRGGIGLEGAPRAKFKRWLLAELVDRKLLLQEARRRRIRPKREEVRRGLARAGAAGWERSERAAAARLEDEFYELRQIEDLLRAAVRPPREPADAEIERYRAVRPAEFRRPARVRLRQSVVHSAAMIAKARREIESAPARWVERDDVPAALWTAVWSAVPGAVAGPVVTPAGWHVFEVQARETSEPLPDAEARALARRRLLDARRHEAAAGWLERLRGAAEIRIDLRAVDAL